MYWVYDLPLAGFGIGTVLVFTLLSVIGLRVVRRPIAQFVGTNLNDVVSYYFAAIGVFYALTIGLIAVSTWQAYSDSSTAVGLEAASLGSLYRNVGSYPEPPRQELQALLKEYTRFVIEAEWPEQQQGIVPGQAGVERNLAFQKRLNQYEPQTAGQQALHTDTLRNFSRMIELRRGRLQVVTLALPAAMWWMIIIGAALTTVGGYLFHLQPRAHIILTILLAAMIGLLVFLIAALDNPFRGAVSIGPDAFVAAYKGLMGGK